MKRDTELETRVDDFGPLFTARADDTKRESYARVLPFLPEMEREVLEALKGCEDLTTNELSEKMHIPGEVNRLTRQVFNLRDRGLIVKGPKRKCTRSGNTCQSWKVKP